jgi:hypothetical protein
MFGKATFSVAFFPMFLLIGWSMSKDSHSAGFDDLPRLMTVANQTAFEPLGFHIDFLAMHSDATRMVAQWIFDKWHPYDASLTKERLVTVYRASEKTDGLPISFILLKGSNPIGVVSLKKQMATELQDLSKDTLWLGTPIFIPEENDESHYKALLDFAKKAAAHIGYHKLYVYTSSPENAKRYINNGATHIEKRAFRDHQIDILVFDLLK